MFNRMSLIAVVSLLVLAVAACGGTSTEVSDSCREAFADIDVSDVNSSRIYSSVIDAGYDCASVAEFAAAISDVDGIALEGPLTTRPYSPGDMEVGVMHAAEYCWFFAREGGSTAPICDEFDLDTSSGRATFRP